MNRHGYFGALLAGLVVFTPLFAFGQPKQGEHTNVWAKAEASIEAHLKGIDPKMRFAEFKSERLSKYLPDFRVFVRFDRHMIGETRLFLVNRDAEITDLREEDWRGDSTAKCWRVTQIAEFLRARKIRVESQESAIEFAKFFEELQGAPNYVAFLQINTKDFSVFDKRFMERHYGPSVDWKFTSEKRDGGWMVKVEYVGPPAMVMQPPTYELDIDKEGNFYDLRRYPYSIR